LNYFFNVPTKSSLLGEKSPNLVTLLGIEPPFCFDSSLALLSKEAADIQDEGGYR
jgi:hypothetical protein